MFFTTKWFPFQYYIYSFEYSSKLLTLAVRLPPFSIISEEEDFLIGFDEFDLQLFLRKRLLLRIYSSARDKNQNKPTAR
jgi:hypothetical protein